MVSRKYISLRNYGERTVHYNSKNPFYIVTFSKIFAHTFMKCISNNSMRERSGQMPLKNHLLVLGSAERTKTGEYSAGGISCLREIQAQSIGILFVLRALNIFVRKVKGKDFSVALLAFQRNKLIQSRK